MENKNKYVAHDACGGEYCEFETFEDAERWLFENVSEDGYTEEFADGKSYIAEIKHRTSVNKTDFVSDYPCKHNVSDHCFGTFPDCPEDCDGEEWPFDPDFTWMGEPVLIEVS